MKKSLIVLASLAILGIMIPYKAYTANNDMVTIQVPASELENLDIKYQNKNSTSASNFMNTVKKTTKKTIDSTKKLTKKMVAATKKATKKTADSTKEITDKTVSATKSATKKTVNSTKEITDKTVKSTKGFTDKTVDGTKEFFENINPNKQVTVESLENKAQIKTLKNERNELKSAYNSRIKDIEAKIKLTQVSSNLSETQRQNRIYNLNKEKEELINTRDKAVENYNNKIKNLKIEQ